MKEQSSPPAIKDMATTLVKSSLGWAKSGFTLTPDAELARRFSLCHKCDQWNADGFVGSGRCMKCGCATQAKLRLASESCPLGKW